MFKELTTAEEKAFRKWARDNYTPDLEVSPVWHPVVREEIEIIRKERQPQDDYVWDDEAVEWEEGFHPDNLYPQ